MKHNWLGVTLALLVLAATLSAQDAFPKVSSSGEYDHAEIGAFFNYTRLHNANDTNFYGVGGRIGVNIFPDVQLEAEGAYDFEQNVRVSGLSGETSGLRIAHFMFGPKLQWRSTGPVHLFLTVKGGLINFSTHTNYGEQISGIPSGDTYPVFYPGGGIEIFKGWLGMRLEAGDEMYFDHGANHNLRVTAGPVIRF